MAKGKLFCLNPMLHQVFLLTFYTFLLQFISEDTIFVFILLVLAVKPKTPYSHGTLCSYAAVSQRPVYPSSKPGKDWDKLEAEVKKQVPLLAPQAWLYFTSYYFCLSLLNVQEKDEKLDGDAAMNKFFSDIYQSADEDMRRAMNKSFVSSSISSFVLTTYSLFF